MNRHDARVSGMIFRLVAERRERGLSQAALARRLGVSQTALSYWESGKRDVAFTDVVLWADTLGLTVFIAGPAEFDGPLPELVAGGLS